MMFAVRPVDLPSSAITVKIALDCGILLKRNREVATG
jgi:hypothetical protein